MASMLQLEISQAMKDDKLPFKNKIAGQLQRPVLRKKAYQQGITSEMTYALPITAELLELRCRGF